jgi:tryptophan-rich sensory protein
MAYHGVRGQAVGLAGWLLVSFAAAAVGGVASAGAGGFYGQVDRPGWAPPGWVFGPVWTVLYALQGVSAWLVWRARRAAGRGRRAALMAFVGQLAVNALWSWLFFAWRRGGLAFGEVVVLLAMVGVTAALFWRVRPLAGALLLPYLLWVGYATVLTYSIWQRNPQLLG